MDDTLQSVMSELVATSVVYTAKAIRRSWSRPRRRADDENIEIATRLSAVDVLSRVDVFEVSAVFPPGVSEGAIFQALRSIPVQKITHEMLACSVGHANQERHEQVRELLTKALLLQIGDGAATDACALLVNSIQTVVDDIRASVEAMDTSETLAASSAAHAALIISTVENVSRHWSAAAEGSGSEGWDTFRKNYLELVREHHSTVTPPDLEHRKKVPIADLYVSPVLRAAGDFGHEISMNDMIAATDRRVLLGDPGGGKSTLSHVLVHNLASEARRTPFHIVLREFLTVEREDNLSISEYIGLRLKTLHQLEPPKGFVEHALLSGEAFVVLDGLDELLDTTRRVELVDRIDNFARRYPLADIVVTSRRVGYRQAPVSDELFDVYELEGFDDDQVEEYARKWFNLEDDVDSRDSDGLVAAFMAESEPVSDIRRNPLMLSLICILYRGERYIPSNRADVYEACANMLFQRWDGHRGIHARVDARKHMDSLLKHLALWMLEHDTDEGVTEHALVAEVTEYLFEQMYEHRSEAEIAAREFVEFCRGRAWVFSAAGTTKTGQELYKFTHRTFMEFFAAFEMTRICESPERLAQRLLPSVAKVELDVVGRIAIQLMDRAVKNGAERTLTKMLDDQRRRTPANRFNVVSFAARAVGELPVPVPLVRRVTRAVGDVLLDQNSGLDWHIAASALSELMNTSEEVRKIVAGEITELCVEIFALGDEAKNRLAWSFIVAITLPLTAGLRDTVAKDTFEFWSAWAEDLKVQFPSHYERAVRNDGYLAVRATLEGTFPLEEYLENFCESDFDRLFQSEFNVLFGVRRSMARSVLIALTVPPNGDSTVLESPSRTLGGAFARLIDTDALPVKRSVVGERLAIGLPHRRSLRDPVAEDVDLWFAATFVACVLHEFAPLRGSQFENDEAEWIAPFLRRRRTGDGDIELPLPGALSKRRSDALRRWADGEQDFVEPRSQSRQSTRAARPKPRSVRLR